jgi:hypothetical protein
MQLNILLSKKNVVRIAVIIACLLFIFNFLFREIFWDFFESDYKKLLPYDGFDTFVPIGLYAFLGLVLFLASHILLLIRKLGGLNLLMGYYFYMALSSLFTGLSVSHPIEVFIGWLILILDVVIVFLLLTKNTDSND